MSFCEYAERWNSGIAKAEGLYLKDWHFVNEFPDYKVLAIWSISPLESSCEVCSTSQMQAKQLLGLPRNDRQRVIPGKLFSLSVKYIDLSDRETGETG